MPQLVPFYFVNQVTFAFVFISTIFYILSIFVLPRFVRVFVSRIFLNKI